MENVVGDVKGAVEALENVFAEQDEFFMLREKAREKQKKIDIKGMVEKLITNYSFDFDEYRVFNSFLMGMTKDEIKVLYMNQRNVAREKEATEEGFEKIVDQLIKEGWLEEVNGKVEVDYEFLECLEEVDRG